MPNSQYFSYFAKKKSFAQKLTFLNTIVSPLNNCLLKSRKLEILKCESLKSCVSKKNEIRLLLRLPWNFAHERIIYAKNCLFAPPSLLEYYVISNV